jgi:hypothetical protein
VRRLLLVALLVGVAACSGGDDDGATTTSRPGSDSGCPVEPEAVAAVLGAGVTLDERTASRTSCTFLATGDEHAGGRVTVVDDRLPEGEDLGAARAAAATGGELTDLPAGLVAGADDGWVVAAGRAVQVAALHDRHLVTVVVADPALDQAAAQAAAARLAADLLGS